MPIGNMLANFGNRGGLLTRMEQSRGIGIRNNLNEYARTIYNTFKGQGYTGDLSKLETYLRIK